MKTFLITASITAIVCLILINIGPGAVFYPAVILTYACLSMS